MQNRFFYLFVLALLISCKSQTKKGFEVSGTIKNSNSKIVYLEETPLASGERVIADSSNIANDGSYHLKGSASEESLFSLFLKNEIYPFAYVINDASKITVDADGRNRDDYEVKGSPASKSLKEFSISASNKWAELYWLSLERDSLKKSGASDSSLLVLDINKKGRIATPEYPEFRQHIHKKFFGPDCKYVGIGDLFTSVFDERLPGIVGWDRTKISNSQGCYCNERNE